MRRAFLSLALALGLSACAWWQEPIVAPTEPVPAPVEAPAPVPAPIELPGGGSLTPAPAPMPPAPESVTKGDAVIDTVAAGVGAITGNPMLAFALAALAKLASQKFKRKPA
jgi:hypothetical protein